MKRKTVLVIYNEEELQKVNDQLAFMQEQPILNSGKFPRYFKVTNYKQSSVFLEFYGL